MIRNSIALCLAFGLLAGCSAMSDSNLNPFNWFSQSEEVEGLTPVVVARADPRPLVAEITGLRIDRAPGGAIVVARGLPPRQGYYLGALVEARAEPQPGLLQLTLRAFPPQAATRVSTVRSREIYVAQFFTDAELAGIRQISVVGQENGRVARR